MTIESRYRLGEYVIIEHGGILLTWASHIALGAQLNGRCFIIGSILIIGPKESEEAGFLKLEFFEQLMELPPWTKTTYYCFASSILKVGMEQSIMNDLIEHPYYAPKIEEKAFNLNKPGIYRLGRYKITANGNSNISWQTIGELNRTIRGKCLIESGILFIGPKEIESDDLQNRRDFFAGQKQLPQWDKTFAWAHLGSLMKCREPELRKPHAAIWKPVNVKSCITKNMPFYQSQQFQREDIQELTTSVAEWLKIKWHRIIEWKIWGRFAPVAIAGVLMVVRFIVFFIRKCASISLRIIDCFREYFKNRG